MKDYYEICVYEIKSADHHWHKLTNECNVHFLYTDDDMLYVIGTYIHLFNFMC